MDDVARNSLSKAQLEDSERRAFAQAVARALADPRPDVPHREMREELLATIRELERQIASNE